MQRSRLALCSLCLTVFSVFSGCSVFTSTPTTEKVANGVGAQTESEKANQEMTATACVTTAEALESKGHLREAAQLYEKARGNNPRQINYARRLAVIYDRLGDPIRAKQEYEIAMKRAPDDVDLLNDFGYFQLQAGRIVEAETLFRKVVAASPGHEHATVNLGVAIAKQGRWQESYQVFEKLLGPAAAHSNVGVLMAKAGHNNLAIQAFQQALSVDPNLPQARAFLQKLAG